ncbi:phosphatase PAP2 family protein [Cellulomonas sp. APG4]|uniref:phosphatase PAP2 family protein n=1 Tax=Cellulomonas sp. APG4 TaxID=1538656 RepID=UPI00137B1AF3|nr:phosphatase PAP2 family protein [Cellulomonas sp. APG4]
MPQPPTVPPLAGGRRDPAEPTVRRASGAVRVRSARTRRWAFALTVASVVGIVVVWRVFVLNRTGQQLDDAAFVGAERGQSRLLLVAEPVLSVISVPFITIVLLSAMLLAVLRRRVLLAVQVAVLVGGANLTTQVLKHMVLERPDLGVGDPLDNALPSGHTTAAASVAAALLFVVPRRVRPTAAVVGVLYTVATGVSTLVGRWHRPSDAVAAVLVVLAWAGVASMLGRRGWVSPGQDPAHGVTAVVVGLLMVGAGAGAGAAIALRRGLTAVEAGTLEQPDQLVTAYVGGALGVLAVTCLAFGLLLLLRRLADHPVDHPGEALGAGGPGGSPHNPVDARP